MGVMLETVSLTVSCSCCGSASLAFHGGSGDDAQVVCLDCEAELGDWAEVKEQARAAVADALRDDFHHIAREALARGAAGARPSSLRLAA